VVFDQLVFNWRSDRKEKRKLTNHVTEKHMSLLTQLPGIYEEGDQRVSSNLTLASSRWKRDATKTHENNVSFTNLTTSSFSSTLPSFSSPYGTLGHLPISSYNPSWNSGSFISRKNFLMSTAAR